MILFVAWRIGVAFQFYGASTNMYRSHYSGLVLVATLLRACVARELSWYLSVLPKLSLGTWTYIFQGLLVLSLMILRKKFVPQYLFSFVVGFAFSELLDVHESWINVLPLTPGYRVIYFLISYILLCIGIALSNRCKLPIIPTDLFPRELSDITSVTYSKIKVGFDVTCLAVTAGLTFAFLGHLDGLGIGTILAAFTMGKVIGLIGKWMDRHACFVSFMTQRQTA